MCNGTEMCIIWRKNTILKICALLKVNQFFSTAPPMPVGLIPLWGNATCLGGQCRSLPGRRAVVRTEEWRLRGWIRHWELTPPFSEQRSILASCCPLSLPTGPLPLWKCRRNTTITCEIIMLSHYKEKISWCYLLFFLSLFKLGESVSNFFLKGM